MANLKLPRQFQFQWDGDWNPVQRAVIERVKKACEWLFELIWQDKYSHPWVDQFGSLTVTGASATGTWAFPLAETDTAYNVVALPVSSTGAPAAGSNRVLSATKTTTQVTLTVEVAPGVGNSVTFDIAILRQT